MPSLDGSPPAHESDIERAIDAALADLDFDGWLEWFETVTVAQIRTRGDGVLVRVDLHPHIDPAIPSSVSTVTRPRCASSGGTPM